MKTERFPIEGLVLITPQKFGDARGFFSETFSADRFAAAGIPDHFVQDMNSP